MVHDVIIIRCTALLTIVLITNHEFMIYLYIHPNDNYIYILYIHTKRKKISSRETKI